MSFIKKSLSIIFFIFCFLTALGLLSTLVDSSYTSDDKIFGSIFYLIISTLSFLFARWLWFTDKRTLHLDSVMQDIEPRVPVDSDFNWIKKTLVISSSTSGTIALYLYLFPYRSALSKVGESSGWMDFLCFVADLFEDHVGCRAAHIVIDWSKQNALKEQIASLESWIFFLAVIFVVGLVVAVLLPRNRV